MKDKRIYDPRTHTYAFDDGSGSRTPEQIFNRECLRTKIEMAEAEPRKYGVTPFLMALMKIHYLTFFSAINNSNHS
jgi:hypothetical protein